MLPFLNATKQTSKQYVVAFRGVNYGDGYVDGEFSETKNISTEAYPCVAQRYARTEEMFDGECDGYSNPEAIHIKDGIIIIDGKTVRFNGKQIENFEVTEGKKHLATVGNYVFIFPDKKYIEIIDEDVKSSGSMEVTVENVDVSFASDSIQAVNFIDGMSGLKFAENSISATTEDIPWQGLGLEKGDTVTISGCIEEANNKSAEIIEVKDDEKKLVFADSTFAQVEADENPGPIKMTCANKAHEWQLEKGDSITIEFPEGEEEHKENKRSEEIVIQDVKGSKLVFSANAFTANTIGRTEKITIKRTVPELTFVCESNNRLWGVNGNTIYGSKFGDPKNFKSFGGSAGDSYYIDVGSEGEFTACINYSTHICFFKENTLHKLYGSKPANFQLVSSQVYGVQAGSERSLCIINETLFYKGVNGVYAYTGGVPELISEPLGPVRTSIGTCAATDGNRYYLCLHGEEKNGLYVFDTGKELWVREDDLNCVDMAVHDGYVYFLSDNKLLKVDPDASRSDIEWSITFCPFHETINERKGYSKFHLRLDLAAGAWLQVEVKRNTDTRWKTVYTTHNEREKTITIPILPARCDSVEIRLSGKGVCKLRTFIREFFVGSDV